MDPDKLLTSQQIAKALAMRSNNVRWLVMKHGAEVAPGEVAKVSMRWMFERGLLDDHPQLRPWEPPWTFRVASSAERCLNGCRVRTNTQCVDNLGWDPRTRTLKPVCWHCYKRWLQSQSCHYCGKQADSHDHIVSPRRGGLDMPSNWLPACRSCNTSKTDKTIEEWVEHRERENRARRRVRVECGFTREDVDFEQLRLAV